MKFAKSLVSWSTLIPVAAAAVVKEFPRSTSRVACRRSGVNPISFRISGTSTFSTCYQGYNLQSGSVTRTKPVLLFSSSSATVRVVSSSTSIHRLPGGAGIAK